MEREKTHRKIDELTTLISVNNNRMMLHEERIPQLDIDLLRKNAIELYEAINLLHIQNLKDKSQAVLLEKSEEEALEKTGKGEEKSEKEVLGEVKQPQTEVKEEVKQEKKPEKIKEEDKPKPVAKEEKIKAESNPEKPAGNQHLYEKLNRSSIQSIKKTISISKRYEVQAALFKNDPDAYNEAINKLDDCDDAASALKVLNDELKSSYGWDDEDPLVEELSLLVERRYA